MPRSFRPPQSLVAAGALCAALAAPAVFSLPQTSHENRSSGAGELLRNAVPVEQIPAARSAGDLTAIDVSHVLLSTAGDRRYVLTLSRQCPELRWAKHIGITASGNSIWAGFDALTADGQSCQIREIHRLEELDEQTL
jgi:hypothetical protein